ncbi:hypothetical protein BaRGS_00031316 [Batillaria attramentaria]|uniref:Uncharacterized protein n=1 Tax=Batillaria attramentaria TaxID=370345 RepID=A0ABD0JS08_9CAEN
MHAAASERPVSSIGHCVAGCRFCRASNPGTELRTALPRRRSISQYCPLLDRRGVRNASFWPELSDCVVVEYVSRRFVCEVLSLSSADT